LTKFVQTYGLKYRFWPNTTVMLLANIRSYEGISTCVFQVASNDLSSVRSKCNANVNYLPISGRIVP